MIPVSRPDLGEAERELVAQALRAGEISAVGGGVRDFEEQWAARCGRRHGVAVANGTVALQLAVACLELEPGDEIVMPTFTIISCALAAIYNGAIPRFVDAEPRAWTMDVEALEGAIGPRTRAVMPVHIYGHPVDMDPVLDLAERHGLAVIEDAAEAHGAEYRSRRSAGRWLPCGGFGDASCFSFYANKLVTTGEGGMLVTDNDDLAERARQLRNLAFGGTNRFRHERLGFNFRMTNLQAALGLPQIARLERTIERKRAIAAAYRSGLDGVAGLQLPAEEPWARSVYWMYGIVLEPETGLDAAELAVRLRERGVETRPFFLGLHEQPALRGRVAGGGESFPVAERLARQGLYLPSGPALEADEISLVIDAIQDALA